MIAPGSRVGPFEVTALIGAGGMGEVYKARDTRLGRDVALKVLPASLAADGERLARLSREARTLALLNHPNIAQIHGVEDVEGARALVMEFVPGADLAARLRQGPLPIDEAVAIARQIADALEAAHEQGIIHRDLKPANVKVRDDGTVKVLDFGLAKAVDAAIDRPDASGSLATITSPAMTQMGVILGTAAYMAPEQAKGKAIDRRADIWAFGVVLFEMLAGRRPFDGDSVVETLAHVMTRDVDLAALPPATPRQVRHLIARCLVKDPRRRLRDIGEARLILDAPLEPASESTVTTVTTVSGRGVWRAAIWLAAAVSIGAGLGWAAARFRANAPPPPLLERIEVAVQPDGAPIGAAVISPDGRSIVFQARDRLWIQRLDEWTPRQLAGTDGASRPFWSPGSDTIAFMLRGRLNRMPAAGGQMVTLGAFTFGTGGTAGGSWRDDGIITLATGLRGAPSALFLVPAAGGPATPIATPADVSDYHTTGVLSGRADVLVSIHAEKGPGGVGYLRDGKVTKFLTGTRLENPQYSPTGHLVYQSEGENPGIWAVPFSPDGMTTSGDPFFVAAGTSPSVSRDGTLAYISTPQIGPRQLIWVTRTGAVAGVGAPPQTWNAGFAISPDGRHIAASDSDGIWIYDVGTKARRRVTRNGDDNTPVWVSGDRIAFTREGTRVMIAPADGSGAEQMLARPARTPRPFAGGQQLAVNARVGNSGWEPAWLDLARPGEIHRLGASHLGGRFPEASPDGRFMLYISNETGDDEVWVTRFPSGQGKWQVSSGGGGFGTWSPRGDEILFLDRTGGRRRLSSVRLIQGVEPSFAAPEPLFDFEPAWSASFAVAPDASRFLLAAPADRTSAPTSVRIVKNWTQEFVKRP